MSAVWKQALEEAKQAGYEARDRWLREMKEAHGERQMYDLCGFAGLKIKDGRSAFYRWYKTQKGDTYGGIHIDRGHCRQEIGLNETIVQAQQEVLTSYGIKTVFWSRLD